ncbi:MAG: DUF853 family protein [Tissierellia bacterium]|nr:DUF853 family protein [Tissierellia bacterium]
MDKFLIGRGDKDANLLSNKLNQHGLIAGATGTGKTVTLKVMTEYFSNAGIPTIIADVKGDLANLCKVGEMNPKLSERLKTLGIENFEFQNFPIRLWDVYGEKGLPLRITISEIGPIMLARILDLNEVQSGILNICFRVADENGLLLLDLKDLRAMLNFVSENRKEYSQKYGNIATQSVGAIQRALLNLEDRGGNIFFGEPSIEISDLLTNDSEGHGYVNIIAADKLIQNPLIYSMFLLWLLSELYETLPEVGNPDKPKLVFFFDEAHLLFEGTPSALTEKIEQIVRLIRSKGVGIFFVTQNPIDVPDKVASQLGNRVLHQLRAFSPRELKAVNSAADTFRPNPNIDVRETITELKVGEALTSFLMEDGAPSPVERTLIMPPKSSFEPLTESDYNYIIENSNLYHKYKNTIDRESAYEILEKKAIESKLAKEEQERKEAEEKQRLEEEKQKKKKSSKMTPYEKAVSSFLGTMSRSIGREIARGVFGTFKRK